MHHTKNFVMSPKMQLRLLSGSSKWLLTIGLVSAGLAILGWLSLGLHRSKIVIPSHTYQLADGRMDEWRAVGGDWKISSGIIYNN
jgi:hypothetical protein